jgi:hypothetical protein
MDVYYPGAPHGITATHQGQVTAELLTFLRAEPTVSPARRSHEVDAMAATPVSIQPQ